jgi:hypothetical protein
MSALFIHIMYTAMTHIMYTLYIHIMCTLKIECTEGRVFICTASLYSTLAITR